MVRATVWTSMAVVVLGAERPSDADRIAKIERGLNLPELMKRHCFGHIGGNVGYQATFVMFKPGDGAVIMTNSDVGLRVGNALLSEIAKQYGWNYTAPAPL